MKKLIEALDEGWTIRLNYPITIPKEGKLY